MVYAMSDVHGCYKQYKELLEKIQFSDDDLLYVLGDVIDRGPEPVKVLQDMASRINVISLIGNHEYMALTVLKKLMMEITEENCESVLNYELMQQYRHWLSDGGQVTMDQFKKLSLEEREFLMEYLEEFSLFEEVECKGERYVLVHADLAGDDKSKDLEEYGVEDIIFTRADYKRVYDESFYLVTGHTPTFLIDTTYTDKIYKENRHIAIDCGCVFGHRLGVYCFDTGECIYSSEMTEY